MGRVRRKPHFKAGRWYKPKPRFGAKAYSPTGGHFRMITRYVGIGTVKVARMVCEAFHGAAPADRPFCLHADEDSGNNRSENLYWGTQAENLNSPKFIAYCKARIGDDSPYRKGLKRQAH